jgi:hypothetical protein
MPLVSADQEQTITRRHTLAFSLAGVLYHELWHNLGYRSQKDERCGVQTAGRMGEGLW